MMNRALTARACGPPSTDCQATRQRLFAPNLLILRSQIRSEQALQSQMYISIRAGSTPGTMTNSSL